MAYQQNTFCRKMDIRLSSPYFMPGCRKVPDKQIAGDQYGISNAGVKYIRKVAVQQRYQRATGYAHNEERRADLGESPQVGDGQWPYRWPHQRVGEAQQCDKKYRSVPRCKYSGDRK